jgi:hypothetical protein
LSPRTISGQVAYSRQTLINASPAIEGLIRNDLARQVAEAIDVAAINGVGVLDPQGLLQRADLPTVSLGADGGAPTIDAMLDLIGTIDVANALDGSLQWLTNPKFTKTIAKIKDGDGRYMLLDRLPGALLGYPLIRTTSVPSDLGKGSGTNLSAAIFGDWSSERDRLLGASLGTDDFERGKLALARWVIEHADLPSRDPRAVTLAVVFQRYHEHHGRHVVGDGQQRRNLFLMLERLPGVTVAELTTDRQRRLVRDLRAAGYADGTIKRILGAGKAACTWAWKRGDIAAAPPFLSIADGPPRERVLSIAELAALWDAAETDYMRAFLLLLIGTAARPKPVLELTRFQCDLDRRLIDLNPPGRPQTKKRRPVVPMQCAGPLDRDGTGRHKPLHSWSGRGDSNPRPRPWQARNYGVQCITRISRRST